MNLDRPVRLCRGIGSRSRRKGCWMAALHHFVHGGEKWTDKLECVDPVVRGMCIVINDALPSDAARASVIGPRLFEPLGTNHGPAIADQRSAILARRVVTEAMRRLDLLPSTTLRMIAARVMKVLGRERIPSPLTFLEVHRILDDATVVVGESVPRNLKSLGYLEAVAAAKAVTTCNLSASVYAMGYIACSTHSRLVAAVSGCDIGFLLAALDEIIALAPGAPVETVPCKADPKVWSECFVEEVPAAACGLEGGDA